MVEVKTILVQYKNYTELIIKNLEQEIYDDFEEFIQKRQSILESLENMDFSEEEIKSAFEELELNKLHDKLMKLMECKLDLTRKEIEKTSKIKLANSRYNKNMYGDTLILSKKI